MSALLGDRFTLIVPTYNRPRELARLLAYLGRERAPFPVLVLDSSTGSARQQNAAALGQAGPRVRGIAFGSAMPPWEKFGRGVELVQTEYCAFCADDDLVLVNSLGPLIDFLDANTDYSLAHGWYFSFYETSQFGITESVYRGDSIEGDDALTRLHALFRRYEALTYAIHRTRVMRRVMHAVQRVRTMLAKELLGGALAVTTGKAARLPIFYYGRALSASQPYAGWHPLEMLLSGPKDLYRDYADYRGVLAESIAGDGDSRFSPEELSTILDLIHFRYLSEYVKPGVMDYLVEQALARRPKAEVIQGMWSVLAGTDGPVIAKLRRSALLRRVRDRFLPALRLAHLKKLVGRGMKSVRSATASGTAREYLLYDAFLKGLPGTASPDEQVAGLVRALDNY